MCVRCERSCAPGPLGLCPACVMATRDEVTEGLRQLVEYLALAALGRTTDEPEPI
jgi:hypothetical protein